MGRNNKKYSKTLHQQAYDRLTAMQAFGESKREAKLNGTDRDKIFSFATYQTYWKHTKYFLAYVKEQHPECTTLKKARAYVGEWLQTRVDEGKSAWTVSTEAMALNKLYGIQPDDDDFYQPPQRVRSEVTRSRGDKVRDRHFSEKNNDELVKFCKGTGLRRSELEDLRGKDLVSKAEIESEIQRLEQAGMRGKHLDALKDARVFAVDHFVHVRNGKGGKERYAPIIGATAPRIVERIENTQPEEKVWLHVHAGADIHSYRGDYATAIYKAHARKIEEIPYDKTNKGTGRPYQSGVYTCRGDESGKKLDKEAMLVCSKALGHNRISVVAESYIRGL